MSADDEVEAAAADAETLFEPVDKSVEALPDSKLQRFLSLILLVAAMVFFIFVMSTRTIGAPTDPTEMATRNIEIDLMYYQRKLSNGGRPHCEMSIDEFRRYHQLQDELFRREAR